ncbi:MAG: hypothetical protein R3E68_05655 [Burkholderiaceae bacterium]
MPGQSGLAGLLVGALTLTDAPVVDMPDSAPPPAAQASTADWSDAPRRTHYAATRRALETRLREGASRADYLRILQDNGFRVTAVNLDQADRLEVEIAKDDLSYEVLMSFGPDGQPDGPARARTRVTSNQWLADATRDALQAPRTGSGTAPADRRFADVAGGGAAYRDSIHQPAWERARDELERALIRGHKADEYRRSMKRLGFEVTARHEKDHRFAEYELVRDSLTFEIRIERNAITLLGRQVQVTSNLWRATDTWAALDDAQRR